MFTGIVEEIGIVDQIKQKENLSILKVCAKKVAKGIKVGDSVAINGVCLTVTRIDKDFLSFDVMQETLLKTTLGEFQADHRVNLERALKVGDRLSGHFVTGHVDVLGQIQALVKTTNYLELKIAIAKNLVKYLVPKGSVCVDGVSLTVGEVKKDSFSVYLIPFTKDVTTLGLKKKGDQVNIETDILAKYILKS